MKLKLTADGHAVVLQGKPVYVYADGREEAFDGPAVMKIALGKHFQASPVMASLKIPSDVAAAFFGDSFRIEDGKLKAVDANGTQIYSITRHGEAADFDEAFGELVNRYQGKAEITREGGAPTAGQPTTQASGAITRTVFDAMPQAGRAEFLRRGGRIGEDVSTPALATPPPSAGTTGAGKSVSRAQFDVMGTQERGAHFKAGGNVVD